jgi:hypothetical protein
MKETTTVSEAIAKIVETVPTDKCWKALQGIQWVLRSEAGLYVECSQTSFSKPSLTTDLSRATVYTGQDNEKLKASFFSVILKTPVTPELISTPA